MSAPFHFYLCGREAAEWLIIMKIVSRILAMIMLVSVLCTSAYAADKTNMANSIAMARSEGAVFSSQDAVYDFRKLSTKAFTPEVTGSNGVMAVTETNPQPYWVADSDLSTRSLLGRYVNAKTVSDSYLQEDKTTKLPIDLIVAKAKLYQNGALAKSKQDSQTHASHAGISITSDELDLIIVDGLELYGSHSFEQQGYVSWYPETYREG